MQWQNLRLFQAACVYNKRFNNYVLWINVYNNVVGYRVFTGKTPTGPFGEAPEPKLAVNSTMPAVDLTMAIMTLLLMMTEQSIAYTDWRTKDSIVIESLTANYLPGMGEHVKAITKEATEAPGLKAGIHLSDFRPVKTVEKHFTRRRGEVETTVHHTQTLT